MKKIKIGFLWHNVSSGNMGVGALAISNMILIDSILNDLNVEGEFYTIGDYEISAIENHGLVEKQINHKFTHIPISIRKILTDWQEYKKFRNIIHEVDYIVDNGAGDSFADIYGLKRFIMQASTKIYAILMKKKMILAPQTIGPFKSHWAQKAADFIIQKSSLTFARDQISYELGKKFGDCKLSTDVALTMPYQKIEFDPQFIHVGINISGLLWNGGYTKQNQFGLNHVYSDFIKECIKFFLAQPKVKIHLIAHVIATTPVNQIEDDYAACIELQQKFKDLILAPRFTNPIEVKNYISGMDFFTGGRMHSTIAAFSSGVPVVPYAYSRKFAGLYNTFGYMHVLDAKELTLEQALDMIKTGFFEREELKKEIFSAQMNVNKLINNYKNSIKDFLQKDLNGN